MFRNLFKKFQAAPTQGADNDPVCGMPANSAITLTHEGKTYAFCSEDCKQEFAQHPEKYSSK
ncbi:MAG: YHS domain-containing protein [bacterium]|nr:YHS domain-containing protein [bacterium]